MNKWLYLILALVLVGCTTQGEKKEEVETLTTQPPIIPDILEETATESTVPVEIADIIPLEISDVTGIPSRRTIYFDYDHSNISAEARNILKEHANYLIEHPDAWLRLEGHTDERGSREYNLALAELRLYTSKEMLKILGVQEDQLMILPYGEERPSSLEHDEESWLLNRRVELVYP